MKVTEIDCLLIKLPFRFAFKHSLASRSYSENVIVRVHAESSTGVKVVGYGESVPRDYVTGESPEGAMRAILESYGPQFKHRQFGKFDSLTTALAESWQHLGLRNKLSGASWCAFELAVLDAFGKSQNQNLSTLFACAELPERIRYGGVVPFGGAKALGAALWFYKFFGFQTVKIKVGKDFETDLAKLQLARKILGPRVVLRIDANCAWNRDTTQRFADAARALNIASIEQPVPAENLEDMAYLTRELPLQIMADESLCSVEQAEILAANKICSAFNIRLSKVGGLLAAQEVAAIARRAGIACHMGAQVGESGILSAAGRCFAALAQPLDNCEGSNNFFLLKQDITAENLNVGPGGWGHVLPAPGLGVTVSPDRLEALTLKEFGSQPAVKQSREVCDRA